MRLRTFPFRRTLAVGVVGLVSMASALVVTAAGAEEFVAGSGRGTASIMAVGPSAARLSFVTTHGETISDYLGQRARGESRCYSFGALQGTMEQTVPDITKSGGGPDAEYGDGEDNPLTEWDESKGTGPYQACPTQGTESSQPGSAHGKRWHPLPGFEQSVAAEKTPVGRAAFRIQAVELPGVLSVSGGVARSFAGVYAQGSGLIRAAGGTVDIGRVSILDEVIVLKGLRWEAAQVTDRNDDDTPEKVGSFYIGKVKAFGETHRGVEGAEAQALFDGLNTALGNFGISVEAPELKEKAGVVKLTPLTVTIANGTLRPLLNPLQNDALNPAGQEFIKGCKGEPEEGGGESTGGGGSTDGLLARPDPGSLELATHGDEHAEFDEFEQEGPGGALQDADNASAPPAGDSDSCGVPILALDLALAPFSGAGSMDFYLGGVFGTTEGNFYENPFEGGFGDPIGGGFGGTTTPPADPGGASTAGGPSAGGSPSVAGRTETSFPKGGGNPEEAFVPSDGDGTAAGQTINLRTSPASAVWSIGLLGLAAAMAMGASDYRRLAARRRLVNPIS
jgi:hypothetical protein